MLGGFPYARLVDVVERHTRAILVGSMAVLLLSGLSLVHLRLDMDVLSQLPSRSAPFRDYREFVQRFGLFDSLIILVTGERERIIPFADRLAEKLVTIPDAGSVRYRIDLEEIRGRFLGPYRYEVLSDENLDELARRLEPNAIRERVKNLKRALSMPMSVGARRWILDDPLGVDELAGRSIARGYADPLFRPSGEYFLSPAGDALILIVRPTRSAFDTIFAERLLGEVRAAEQGLVRGEFAGVQVGHTGSYVYAVADKRVLSSDFRLYFLFAPLAVLAIFHVGMRTFRVLPFVTFPLVVTTAVTFALSLVFFRTLNMVSVAFAGIFYGLGIDSAIYFYGLLRKKSSRFPRIDDEAVRQLVGETLAEIGGANVVASVTTAVAFVVIGFSDFTGVSQLGVMTALAMLLNVIATFVLLPAMVFAWGARAIPAPRAAANRLSEHVARIAEALAVRRAWVLAAAALIVALAGFAAGGVRLDTDFTHLGPRGGEAEQVEAAIHDKFGHIDAQGIIMVRGRDADEALGKTERVTASLERYRSEGLVQSYSSLSAFFPSSATAARRLARFRALPRREAASELSRALEAEGFDSRAFEPFIADLIRDERPPIRVEAERQGPLGGLLDQHLRTIDGETFIATYFVPAAGTPLAAIRTRLRTDLPDAGFTVTGRELAEGELARILGRELVWFLAAAIALNFCVVLAAERRPTAALAVLSPTLVALVLYLGIIGGFGIPIDPINLIVLPLLIGLGVDDSVYLLAHVRHAGGLRAGVERGFTALVTAVATTVAGFGSLGLSRFPALASLGWLAALGLSLCLAATILLVPALVVPVATAGRSVKTALRN